MSRSAVRELTTKLFRRTALTQKIDTAFDQVMERMRSGSFPRTPYMVVLLLWAVNEQKEYRNINEAVLVDSIIDVLMGKGDVAGVQRGELGYRGRTLVAQHLALRLRQNDDVSYNDTLNIVNEFLRHKGLSFRADQILREFIDYGILEEYDDHILSLLAFAGVLCRKDFTDDPDLLQQALAGENIQQFSGELDLYTALSGRALQVAQAIQKALLVHEVNLANLREQLEILAHDPRGAF